MKYARDGIITFVSLLILNGCNGKTTSEGMPEEVEPEQLCVEMALAQSEEVFDTDKDKVYNCADTDDDGDGISDADENATGTDPLVTDPWDTDSDHDGLTNAEESDENATTITDENGNGISDVGEPLDSDADGVPDSDKVENGTDPLNRDTDSDGKSDGEEGTADSDGDGTIDALEPANQD
ncbi:MAG: hypothetical protein ACP5D3_07335, partial [Sulfurovum sp.]